MVPTVVKTLSGFGLLPKVLAGVQRIRPYRIWCGPGSGFVVSEEPGKVRQNRGRTLPGVVHIKVREVRMEGYV